MDIYTNQQYYEAILQLRPFDKKVYNFVLNEINKNKNVYITGEEIKKYGINIKLTNSKFTESIGKKLKSKFGGNLIKSRKLYGYSRRKGKIVYRLTICHRLDNK